MVVSLVDPRRRKRDFERPKKADGKHHKQGKKGEVEPGIGRHGVQRVGSEDHRHEKAEDHINDVDAHPVEDGLAHSVGLGLALLEKEAHRQRNHREDTRHDQGEESAEHSGSEEGPEVDGFGFLALGLSGLLSFSRCRIIGWLASRFLTFGRGWFLGFGRCGFLVRGGVKLGFVDHFRFCRGRNFKHQTHVVRGKAALIVADHELNLSGVGEGLVADSLRRDHKVRLLREVRQLHSEVFVKLLDGFGLAHRPLSLEVFGCGQRECGRNGTVRTNELRVDVPAGVNFGGCDQFELASVKSPHRSGPRDRLKNLGEGGRAGQQQGREGVEQTIHKFQR